MSAAAPSAHRQSPDPDSTQPRTTRGESGNLLGDVASRAWQLSRLRGRCNHRLPCEP